MEKKKYEKPSIEALDVQWNECIASSTQYGNRIEILGGEKVNHYKWFGENNNAGEGSWVDSF